MENLKTAPRVFKMNTIRFIDFPIALIMAILTLSAVLSETHLVLDKYSSNLSVPGK
jgi:hypothetical protein